MYTDVTALEFLEADSLCAFPGKFAEKWTFIDAQKHSVHEFG